MILLYFISGLLFQQQYPLNKHKEPSAKGIEMYVADNSEKLISEFQKIVGDSLYDVYIFTENLSLLNLSDTSSLGIFCPPDEIIITNEEKYIAYELKDLSNNRRNTLIGTNKFVKGTIFHELTHYYFMMVIKKMQMLGQYVSPEYNNFSIVPHFNYDLGARFIEEGICEYLSIKTQQAIFNGNFYIPKTVEELPLKENKQAIFYEYSVAYVRSFVNYYGLKKAIQLLVSVKPPTPEQILSPADFFRQLNFVPDESRTAP